MARQSTTASAPPRQLQSSGQAAVDAASSVASAGPVSPTVASVDLSSILGLIIQIFELPSGFIGFHRVEPGFLVTNGHCFSRSPLVSPLGFHRVPSGSEGLLSNFHRVSSGFIGFLVTNGPFLSVSLGVAIRVSSGSLEKKADPNVMERKRKLTCRPLPTAMASTLIQQRRLCREPVGPGPAPATATATAAAAATATVAASGASDTA